MAVKLKRLKKLSVLRMAALMMAMVLALGAIHLDAIFAVGYSGSEYAQTDGASDDSTSEDATSETPSADEPTEELGTSDLSTDTPTDADTDDPTNDGATDDSTEEEPTDDATDGSTEEEPTDDVTDDPTEEEPTDDELLGSSPPFANEHSITFTFPESLTGDSIFFVEAGDENICLLYGVIAIDEDYTVVEVFIIDDGGFHIHAEFPYNAFTVTYGATHPATTVIFEAERNIVVLPVALHPIARTNFSISPMLGHIPVALSSVANVPWLQAPPVVGAPPCNELVNITRENFLDHFQLVGDAARLGYDSDTGIVWFTDVATSHQVGNVTLDLRMDFNYDFRIEGQINLGKLSQQGTLDGFDYQVHGYDPLTADPNFMGNPFPDSTATVNGRGADGIGFGFHSMATGAIGQSGNSHGIGGLNNAFGFIFDTWFNSSNIVFGRYYNVDPYIFSFNGQPFPNAIPSGLGVPFGGFVATDTDFFKIFYTGTPGGSPQQLGDGTAGGGTFATRLDGHTTGTFNPTNGQWHHIEFEFDSSTQELTIVYTHSLGLDANGRPMSPVMPGAQQSWTKNISSLIDPDESYAFIITASTGTARNYQGFRIIEATLNSRVGDLRVQYLQDDIFDAPPEHLLSIEEYTICEEHRVETGFSASPESRENTVWENWAGRETYLHQQGWFRSHTSVSYPSAANSWAYVNLPLENETDEPHIISAKAETTGVITYYFRRSLSILNINKVDPDDTPIEGVTFELRRNSPEGEVVATVTTDADGFATTGTVEEYRNVVTGTQQLESLGLDTLGPGGGDYVVVPSRARQLTEVGTLSPGVYYLVETITPVPFVSADPARIEVPFVNSEVNEIEVTVVNYRYDNELAITKTSTPSIATVGSTATYTLTVRNHSSSPARDLLVVDVINQTFLQFNPASLTISDPGASHNFNSNTGELRVYLTEIAPNSTATITFNVTILPAAEGFTVENIAIVYGAPEDDEDGNRRRPERDRDRDRLPVPGTGNPIVIKTSDTSEAEVGDIISYTISVINRGTAPLIDYLVVDALDQNLVQFNPSSLTVTGGVTTSNFNTATGEIRVYIAELAVNDTVTITFSVTVLEAAAGEDIENIAIVYGPPENGGRRPERNRGRNRIPVRPNLEITKTSSPSPAEVGDIVTYTITVENLSRVTVRDLLVVDMIDQSLMEFIPPSLQVSGANATHHFNATTGELRVYISTLASHSIATITFDVEILPAAEGLTIENIAILYGAPEDDSSDNRRRPERDRDRDRLPVNPPNPSITKTANRATAQVGDIINYTITVTNADEDNAVYDFVVVDMIDLRFVQFMPANFTISAANATHTFSTSTGELRVYLPEIGAGETITITVSVMVLQAALGGNVVNIAVLYGPPTDDGENGGRRPEIDRDRETVGIPDPTIPTQPTEPTSPEAPTTPTPPPTTSTTPTDPTGSTEPDEDPSTDDSTPPTTVDPVEPDTPPTNTPQPTDPAPSTPPQTPSEDPDLREQFPDGGGDNPDIPPLPTVPGNELILSEDGLFWIELDENGVPLGAWHWDDDEGIWIFDPEIPLGAFAPIAAAGMLPQTGLINLGECLPLMVGLTLVIALASLILIKRETMADTKRKEEI